jgi:hypothetical protein
MTYLCGLTIPFGQRDRANRHGSDEPGHAGDKQHEHRVPSNTDAALALPGPIGKPQHDEERRTRDEAEGHVRPTG